MRMCYWNYVAAKRCEFLHKIIYARHRAHYYYVISDAIRTRTSCVTTDFYVFAAHVPDGLPLVFIALMRLCVCIISPHFISAVARPIGYPYLNTLSPFAMFFNATLNPIGIF